MALLKYVRYINKRKETCCHFVKLKSVIFLLCNLEAISSNFIPVKFPAIRYIIIICYKGTPLTQNIVVALVFSLVPVLTCLSSAYHRNAKFIILKLGILTINFYCPVEMGQYCDASVYHNT